jgi:ElaB/YqjD/DUF883 family membrane-anchored ribosome-binding protein
MEEEESKQIKQTLNDLTVKIDELSKTIGKTIGEKKEYTEGKINENPLAYVAGAFVGGVIVGYLIAGGKG